MTKLTTKTSHGSGDLTISQIYDYFEQKAQDALDKAMERSCDLAHFKQVKLRLETNEDLNVELPQLKRLDKKKALAVVKGLIKRCNDDLKGYWAIPDITKSEMAVKHQLAKGDLVPRFNARYAFKTKLGTVDIVVSTQGRHIRVAANTADVKKANTGLALRELEKRLTLAKLNG